MASAPSLLGAPPPSPANPPMGMGAMTPQPGAPPPGSPAPAESPDKALVAMGSEIDRALSALAEVSGGSPEFAEARRLIQAGIAKMLQGMATGSTGASPTSAGSPFPGATPSSPVPRP